MFTLQGRVTFFYQHLQLLLSRFETDFNVSDMFVLCVVVTFFYFPFYVCDFQHSSARVTARGDVMIDVAMRAANAMSTDCDLVQLSGLSLGLHAIVVPSSPHQCVCRDWRCSVCASIHVDRRANGLHAKTHSNFGLRVTVVSLFFSCTRLK